MPLSLSNQHQEHELIWSILSSAATSYRADTLLRPFPSQFILENGDKDLKSLVSSLMLFHIYAHIAGLLWPTISLVITDLLY